MISGTEMAANLDSARREVLPEDAALTLFELGEKNAHVAFMTVTAGWFPQLVSTIGGAEEFVVSVAFTDRIDEPTMRRVVALEFLGQQYLVAAKETPFTLKNCIRFKVSPT